MWFDTRTFAVSWADNRTFDLTMPVVDVAIENVVIADDFRIERVYTGLPTGTTITKAWLTIKKLITDTDAQALVQKLVTTTLGAAGQITDADTTPDGRLAMFFNLIKNDPFQTTVKAKLDYLYDIQVLSSTGEVRTLEIGTISFIRGVTDANA